MYTVNLYSIYILYGQSGKDKYAENSENIGKPMKNKEKWDVQF